MFMVKSEYVNIKNLVKVKIKIQGKGLMWFCVAAAFIVLFNIINTVGAILYDDGIRHYSIMDFTAASFFGLIIAFTIFMFMYRQANNNLSVFPQTNNSRFISSLIVKYALAVCVGVVSLVMYLLCYLAIKLLSVFKENVYLAFNFDASFIVAGFFVFIAYSFLAVAAIELIGTIFRKWTYYAAAVFVALTFLAIYNIETAGSLITKALSFLWREPSIGLFMIKAAALWLAIVALSLVINRFTMYYKSQNMKNNKGAAAVAIVIATMFIFGGTLGMMSYTNNSQVVSEVQPVEGPVQDFYAGAQETRIDVSHLPKGTDININGENIDIIAVEPTMITMVTISGNSLAYVTGTQDLNNLDGDTIVILFHPPNYYVDGVEFFGYAKPQMTAYLEGDTLHIGYSYQDAQVVILPVWDIARQFDCFRGKGLVKTNPPGYDHIGSMGANIHIYVE